MHKRILLVDDEEALLISLKRLLQDKRVQVDTAETMNDAISHINEKDYKVIITDIRLSGISSQDGLEILQYVRENRPETRAILMTAYGSPETMERAFSLGADYYFEKPVSIKALRYALKSLEVG